MLTYRDVSHIIGNMDMYAFDFRRPWRGRLYQWHPERGRFRRMRRGALRFALLKLLAGGERHGYDLLREIRERGWGMPGPASIYPVLAMLETAGFVAGRDEEGRRIYQLTQAGREFLAEHADRVDKILAEFAERAQEDDGGDETRSLQRSIERLVRAVSQLDADSQPETRAKAQEIIDRARKEIYALLAEE